MIHTRMLIILLLAWGVTGAPQKACAQVIARADSLVALARQQHPAIKALELKYQQRQAAIVQSQRLPDARLSGGYFIWPVETRLGAQRAKISISQAFPWFGTLSAAEKQAVLVAEASQQALKLKKRQVAEQVMTIWLNWHTLQAKETLLQQQRQLIMQLRDQQLARVSAGKQEGGDYLRLLIKEEEVMEALDAIEDQRISWQATINELTHTSVQLPDSVALPPLPAINEVQDSAWRRHPALLQANNQWLAAQAGIRLTEQQNKPMFSVGVDYAFIEPRTDANPANNGQNALMPMVGLRVPLQGKVNKADKQAAERASQAHEQNWLAIANRLHKQWVQEKQRLQQARRRIARYQQLQETARAAYRMAEAAYSSNNGTYSHVVSARLLVIDYQIKIVEAKNQKHQAHWALFYLSGNRK